MPNNFSPTLTLTYRDIDGDGGMAPVISADTLNQLVNYAISAKFLNESVTPAEDITVEILAENLDHQLFYIATGVSGQITYADVDADNNPVGLAMNASFTAPGSGSLKVVLRHEPNKSAAGVSLGDIANAGGETDIEVSFPLVIK